MAADDDLDLPERALPQGVAGLAARQGGRTRTHTEGSGSMADIKLRPDVGSGVNWMVWLVVVLAIIAVIWLVAH